MLAFQIVVEADSAGIDGLSVALPELRHQSGAAAITYAPPREDPSDSVDRGIAGPVASIQLANLRRGMQDHLYLSMARALGLHAEVDAALAAVVPQVFTEAGAAVGFAEHGDAYEDARRALAEAIAAALQAGQPLKQ